MFAYAQLSPFYPKCHLPEKGYYALPEGLGTRLAIARFVLGSTLPRECVPVVTAHMSSAGIQPVVPPLHVPNTDADHQPLGSGEESRRGWIWGRHR